MKKYLLYIAAAATLVACDPVEDDKSLAYESTSVEEIDRTISFKQYSDAEHTTEASDGNFVTYTTNPSLPVAIYNYKADGSENILAKGAAGEFYYKPMRGSNPDQVFYVRALNTDGTFSTAEKTLHLYVQPDLSADMKLLCDNNDAPTSKAWYWDPEGSAGGGRVWGNFGADTSWRGDDLSAFVWWGVENPADLEGQLGHSTKGAPTGEEDWGAYMVFSEDGSVNTYDKNNNLIRSGSFEIQDYTEELNGWKYGILHTSEEATLFPYEINAANRGGAKCVTDFEIWALDADKMVLTYPDEGVWDGSWKEGTFWCFTSRTASVAPTLSGEKSWTWAVGNEDCGGRVWGNFGADASWRGSNLNDFIWWGVEDAADLVGQLNHSVTGAAIGEENNNAYMTLNADGTVKCYDASGNEIRSGKYEVDLSTADGWQLGTLKTTEGATLFPFEINAGGKYVTEFQIWSLNPTHMVLTYPDNGAFSGWSEGTYWSFDKK